MRAHIDVSEIEAQTKIRAKYLRALENEEWGLLPGPTFVKSFLRTYADALGLDGKALVEDYRLQHERRSEPFEPIVSNPRSSRPRGRGGAAGLSGRAGSSSPSRLYLLAVSVIGALIVILVVLLLVGGSGSKSPAGANVTTTTHHAAHVHHSAAHHAAPSGLVALSLTPTAPVYVCLLGDGHTLIPGSELHPGTSTPTYHARRFLITLGNNAVTLVIDGRPRTVAPSAQAIGYAITKARGRVPLAPSEQPTCK